MLCPVVHSSLLNSVDDVGSLGAWVMWVTWVRWFVGGVGQILVQVAWVAWFKKMGWVAWVHKILAWLAWLAWVYSISLRPVTFHYSVSVSKSYVFFPDILPLNSLCSFHIEIYVDIKLYANLNPA